MTAHGQQVGQEPLPVDGLSGYAFFKYDHSGYPSIWSNETGEWKVVPFVEYAVISIEQLDAHIHNPNDGSKFVKQYIHRGDLA